MNIECNLKCIGILESHWRFTGRVIALYGSLCLWIILSSVPSLNIYGGFVISVIFASLVYIYFYEAEQANFNASRDNYYYSFLMNQYHKVKGGGQDQKLSTLKSRISSAGQLILIFPVLSAIALFWPVTAYPITIFIGLVGAKLAELVLEKEIQVSKHFRRLCTIGFIVILFSFTILVAWILDAKSMQYGTKNSDFPIFIVGVASWLAVGFIGQIIIFMLKQLTNLKKN